MAQCPNGEGAHNKLRPWGDTGTQLGSTCCCWAAHVVTIAVYRPSKECILGQGKLRVS